MKAGVWRCRWLGAMLGAALLPALAGPACAGWPPQKGQLFPDEGTYVDQDGNRMKLSRFKGKVLLVEYVGMNCPACQAFSGAQARGAYRGNPVQRGLQSIESYFPRYTGGLRLDDPRIVFIQILLYDMQLKAPRPADACQWAGHFDLRTARQEYVLVPERDMRSQASYNLIPGFQLVDRSFRVRSDSTGHYPRDDLYRTLLPMAGQIVK
ncbi:MAG: hypothetical protein KC897_05010 [Candidatus Omnitrophica bacterium]|nr:hypothetical protein [Candidatus Omnitrophota bacterium]MCB9720332.1 hypothetical protein [Candidatus Omnitrophota bacterium]